MTKRARLFLVIGGGVLVLGLTAGLLASYLGFSASALAGPPGPPELAYVAADTPLVAFANMGELMSSEMRRKLFPHRRESSGWAEFEARTGINPETDLQTVVVAFSPGTDDAGRQSHLLLARGSFDEGRIEALMRERGGKVSDYRGARMILDTPDNRPAIAVVFLEPGLVVAGNPVAVRGAVDLKAAGTGKGSIVANEAVMALVRDVDRADTWAVGRFEAIVNRAVLPRDVATQLPPIQWFSARGDVDAGFDGSLSVEARDEAAAKDLLQVVQGFVALARLQAPKRPELAAVLESMQLEGRGATISVSFSVPAAVLETLAAEAERRRRNQTTPAPQ